MASKTDPSKLCKQSSTLKKAASIKFLPFLFARQQNEEHRDKTPFLYIYPNVVAIDQISDNESSDHKPNNNNLSTLFHKISIGPVIPGAVRIERGVCSMLPVRYN